MPRHTALGQDQLRERFANRRACPLVRALDNAREWCIPWDRIRMQRLHALAARERPALCGLPLPVLDPILSREWRNSESPVPRTQQNDRSRPLCAGWKAFLG